MNPGFTSPLRRCVLALLLVAPAAAWADGPPELPPVPGAAEAPPPAPLPPDAPLPGGAPAGPAVAPPLSGPAAAPGDLPLAYKGLRLGMSMAGLKAFVDSQAGLAAGATESLNGVTKVTLNPAGRRRGAKRGAGSDPRDFFSLGCGGAGCYAIQSATVVFLDDRAVSFSLRNLWTLDEALEEPGLKGWLDYVQAAFNKKYGQPALVSLAPGQTEFSDIRDLWNAAPFVQWNSGQAKVLLELSRSGGHCKASIEVQDNAGAAEVLRRGLAGK